MRADVSPPAVGAGGGGGHSIKLAAAPSELACSAVSGACTVVGGRHGGAAGFGLCGGSRRAATGVPARKPLHTS